MVCNLHIPKGTSKFRIWNSRTEEKTLPVSWHDEKLYLLIAPDWARTHNLPYV